ncbi:hypothetical protein BC829DRAFT_418781 [Chytridium lagenaria]|nr:hypothetical protein BC829DRAFT_418781 [Chytridium lagenaria]
MLFSHHILTIIVLLASQVIGKATDAAGHGSSSGSFEKAVDSGSGVDSQPATASVIVEPSPSCISCLNIMPTRCMLNCKFGRRCVYYPQNCTTCAFQRCEDMEIEL